jgi:hypothetical protein
MHYSFRFEAVNLHVLIGGVELGVWADSLAASRQRMVQASSSRYLSRMDTIEQSPPPDFPMTLAPVVLPRL